jgi:predicted Zn-dependent protease
VASFLALFLKLLPTILSLLNKGLSMAHDRQMISSGRAQATAEQLGELSRTVARARTAEAEADAAHAKDQTDGAFDQDFFSKD